MNRYTLWQRFWTLYFRRVAGGALLGMGLATGALWACAQIVVSNAPPHWPSLADVLKTWGKTPIEDVRQAAEKGDLTAQHYLGYCYSEGKRVARDAKSAEGWYQRAGAAGYMPSFNNLGLLYQQGDVLARDPGRAIEFYRRAAEGGLGVSQINLGYAYQDGMGVPRDQEQAAHWFQKAAKSGQPAAMRELYLAFQKGLGPVASSDEARQWLERAADGGDAYAECLLGYSYENPDPEDRTAQPRLREAVQMYRLSAEQDWPGGLYHLALCMVRGKGVALDEERGLELMRRAADQEHSFALAGLAELYARGVGEPRGPEDSPLQLLLRADRASGLSRQDQEQIRSAISFRYRNGLGASRDLIAAALWYCRAGIVIGSHYPLKNKLLGADKFQKAEPFEAMLSLVLKAALFRDPDALCEIGNRYLSGSIALKNPSLAWCWLTLAAQKGAAQASARLPEIETRLSSQELKSAQLKLASLTRDLDEIGKGFQAASR